MFGWQPIKSNPLNNRFSVSVLSSVTNKLLLFKFVLTNSALFAVYARICVCSFATHLSLTTHNYYFTIFFVVVAVVIAPRRRWWKKPHNSIFIIETPRDEKENFRCSICFCNFSARSTILIWLSNNRKLHSREFGVCICTYRELLLLLLQIIIIVVVSIVSHNSGLTRTIYYYFATDSHHSQSVSQPTKREKVNTSIFFHSVCSSCCVSAFRCWYQWFWFSFRVCMCAVWYDMIWYKMRWLDSTRLDLVRFVRVTSKHNDIDENAIYTDITP